MYLMFNSAVPASQASFTYQIFVLNKLSVTKISKDDSLKKKKPPLESRFKKVHRIGTHHPLMYISLI